MLINFHQVCRDSGLHPAEEGARLLQGQESQHHRGGEGVRVIQVNVESWGLNEAILELQGAPSGWLKTPVDLHLRCSI